jgi:hypothetical protein
VTSVLEESITSILRVKTYFYLKMVAACFCRMLVMACKEGNCVTNEKVMIDIFTTMKILILQQEWMYHI